MIRFITTVVLTLLLIAIMASDSAAYDGYLSVGMAEVEPGESAVLDIRLHNNDFDFSAIYVPIRYGHVDLTVDSVSFTGGIKPTDFSGIYFDFTDKGVVQLAYLPPLTGSLPLPTVSATDGVIAQIHFTVSDQAAPGFIPVDSASQDTSRIPSWTGISLSNETGDSIVYPDCNSGGITILVPTGINDDLGPDNLPKSFALSQNYPNPFNPGTVIEYALPTASHVRLEVFNVLGQLTDELVDAHQEAGIHTVTFDAGNRPSGVYFYRLVYDGGSDTKKMLFLK